MSFHRGNSNPDFPLEALKVHGPNYLKHALTSCTDPLKAIEEFQLTNGILLPSLRPMLPLLDLHGVRRLDFHMSVVEELREKLINHINEIGKQEGKERDHKLKELLVKSFPVIRVKAMRPIVMAILKNIPQIEDHYLKVLVRDRELYLDTDTEVKRQIWKDNQSLFGDEVSPLLSQYISEKENVLFDHSNLATQFFGPSPKVCLYLLNLFKYICCLLRNPGTGEKHEKQPLKCYKHIKTLFMAWDNTILILLLRMLALGLSAWVMIDSQDFKEPKLDAQVVTKFLPALMSLMVDDQVRQLSGKLPHDEREAAITVIEHSGPLPDAVEAYLQDSTVASILAMYYTLHAARLKDRVGLLRILTVLANCKDDRAFEDPFLHSFVCLLIHNSDEFQAEDFCTALFDEFFFAGLSRDNVTRHLLKLLWYVHQKLPTSRLHSLMKALQPTHQHSEKVHLLYKLLQDKIVSQEETVIPPEMDIDINSPLMSVPTPAPYHHTL
uniref:Negative elongation factor B n=1 Tax=Diabrotica virgifera virgifera TaxID=50390 RepID=A0A6P7FGL5_DIAVI